MQQPGSSTILMPSGAVFEDEQWGGLQERGSCVVEAEVHCISGTIVLDTPLL